VGEYFFWYRPPDMVSLAPGVHTQTASQSIQPFLAQLTVTTNRHTDRYIPYNTHTHAFNGPLSGTTQVSRYRKGKTNLDFTEARDSEWQWHQLGHMQVCTAPRSMPAPHCSVFYGPDALPATHTYHTIIQ